jgi:hypothetical protein
MVLDNNHIWYLNKYHFWDTYIYIAIYRVLKGYSFPGPSPSYLNILKDLREWDFKEGKG